MNNYLSVKLAPYYQQFCNIVETLTFFGLDINVQKLYLCRKRCCNVTKKTNTKKDFNQLPVFPD